MDFKDDDEGFVPLQPENNDAGDVEPSSPPLPRPSAANAPKRQSNSKKVKLRGSQPLILWWMERKQARLVPKSQSRHLIQTSKVVKLPARERLEKTDYVDKSHDFSGHPQPTERSSMEYYNDYYNDDFYEQMALCTNLYYLRKTGRVLNTTKQKIKKKYWHPSTNGNTFISQDCNVLAKEY